MILLVTLIWKPLSAKAVEVMLSAMENPQGGAWKTQAQGAAKFEFTQYMTASEEDSKLNQSQLVQGDLRVDSQSSTRHLRLDLTAGKFLDLNNSFLTVQELFGSMRFHREQASVAVGRKFEFWSELDSNWQLGLWEPQANNVDLLRPTGQGLTGVFGKARTGSWELLAYASPVFIPTMNPEIREKDGSLVADSRWFKTPSGSGDVLDRETRYVYSLSVPDLRELVSQPGAGARVRYGGDRPGFWASANVARKPMNALLVKYDYNLALQSGGSQAEIEVQPVVGYHSLYGADLGWSSEQGSVSLSFLRDEPDVELPRNSLNDLGEPTTDWIQQSPGGLVAYGAHAERRLNVPGILDPVQVQVDYLKAETTETTDLDAAGEERGAFLPHRLNFTNAASVKTRVSGLAFSKPWATSLRYLREFDQNGSVWTLLTEIRPRRDMVVHAGLDILGVDDDSVGNTDKRFLNQFRANDRVFGGLSYVF